ncbi:unnamed protein product [Durusdinium trenchii]|uniref:UNC-50-like protein n=1 Tax=Durusdinium trenchii TaxID=1381693 RepID=A0ABP0HQZ7_9DINO
MLPLHVESERPSFMHSPSLSEYLRRMLHYAQMDIDYTFAQMLYLCIAPRKVYQLTSYRKQTKNQWARDDPAFVVVLIFFLTVTAIAYSIAFQARGTDFLHILVRFIVMHFIFFGIMVSTVSWFVANNYMRAQSFHGVEQKMEWMYAFDIHCNSFFPFFLVLYVFHYFLLPFLSQTTWLAAIFSNILYGVAACYYLYIMSLGYSTLPFLERTEVILYPAGVVVLLALLLSLCRDQIDALETSGRWAPVRSGLEEWVKALMLGFANESVANITNLEVWQHETGPVFFHVERFRGRLSLPCARRCRLTGHLVVEELAARSPMISQSEANGQSPLLVALRVGLGWDVETFSFGTMSAVASGVQVW